MPLALAVVLVVTGVTIIFAVAGYLINKNAASKDGPVE